MDKKTLDEIFDDDEFGLLDSKQKSSNIKTEEDRLIDAFEEINIFIDKNNREPSTSSMSEYGLFAKLRNFRENEQDKTILKPYDRHNLLGYVELEDTLNNDISNLELMASVEHIKHHAEKRRRNKDGKFTI